MQPFPNTVRIRRRLPVHGHEHAEAANSSLSIVYQPIDALRPAAQQLRKRGKGQIQTLEAIIRRLGCRVPILVTASSDIVDGHAIWEACKGLGYAMVPTIVIDDLSDAEIRTLRLALNKVSEGSSWSLPQLKEEFEHLFNIDPALVHFTAFSPAEVDVILRVPALDHDELPEELISSPVVSRPGDIWLFAGGHRLICGNARGNECYTSLMAGEHAQLLLTDPPYGCKIAGHVSRSHGEFLEGSGMGCEEALAFFSSTLAAATGHLSDGAIAMLFIDSAGMRPLLNAIHFTGLEHKGLCVWDKLSGGMGSLYRQQTEYVVVAKWGKAKHINNVQLGKHGRNRTSLWSYPGLARLQAGRSDALKMHPTVKPVGMLADAILDVSTPGGLVLDPFAGSGSLLLAAHRTKRVARAIELDPKYVDIAARRMEDLTGEPARLLACGRSFAEVAQERHGVAFPSSSSA